MHSRLRKIAEEKWPELVAAPYLKRTTEAAPQTSLSPDSETAAAEEKAGPAIGDSPATGVGLV
jgi:hypothetical protein